MTTPTDIKKLVIGNRTKAALQGQNPRLFLAQVGDELLATNSYWLTSAEMVRPLLEHYNLPADEPGSFEIVGGRVARTEMEPPNIAQIMPTIDVCREIERAEIAGRHAYVKSPGTYLALFQHDTVPVGFDDNFLAWLIFDDQPANKHVGYGSRLTGPPIYRQQSPAKPMLIHAKREKQKGGINGPDGKFIPLEWVDDGEQLLGLLMPVKLG